VAAVRIRGSGKGEERSVTEGEILNALAKRINDNLPIGWGAVYPGVDLTPSLPYVVVTVDEAERVAATISADVVEHEGVLGMTCVSRYGGGAVDAADDAEDFAALFPAALQLEVYDVATGLERRGKIEILNSPSIRRGYRDGADWRVPVVVRYRAKL
jgi:hypothetical protein